MRKKRNLFINQTPTYYSFVPSLDESKSHGLSAVSMFINTCVDKNTLVMLVPRILDIFRKTNVWDNNLFSLLFSRDWFMIFTTTDSELRD